jgi:hypothetical protein
MKDIDLKLQPGRVLQCSRQRNDEPNEFGVHFDDVDAGIDGLREINIVRSRSAMQRPLSFLFRVPMGRGQDFHRFTLGDDRYCRPNDCDMRPPNDRATRGEQ